MTKELIRAAGGNTPSEGNIFFTDAHTHWDQNELLRCDITARPLQYPLSDYHRAMSEGPLNFTWVDKPHRLVYDLIAALKFYAISQPVPPAIAYGAQNTRSGKWAYIWHALEDVDGWVNLQHQSNDEGTYRIVPLAAISQPVLPAERKLHEASRDAAVDTLQHLGYTYYGAALWKPPISQPVPPTLSDTDGISAAFQLLYKRKIDPASTSDLVFAEGWREAKRAQPEQPVPPFGDKRKAAMAVYTPPFKYEHGYIFDSQHLMVADNGGINDKESVEGAVAARVRGWGRLGYLPNGAELQDEIGQMMADALNALYTNISQPVPPAGMKLVPIEPTLAMRVAGKSAHYEAEERIKETGAYRVGGFANRHVRAAYVYSAMINAAPPISQPVQTAKVELRSSQEEFAACLAHYKLTQAEQPAEEKATPQGKP